AVDDEVDDRDLDRRKDDEDDEDREHRRVIAERRRPDRHAWSSEDEPVEALIDADLHAPGPCREAAEPEESRRPSRCRGLGSGNRLRLMIERPALRSHRASSVRAACSSTRALSRRWMWVRPLNVA